MAGGKDSFDHLGIQCGFQRIVNRSFKKPQQKLLETQGSEAMRQEGQGIPGKARGHYGQEQVTLEDPGPQLNQNSLKASKLLKGFQGFLSFWKL